MQTSTQSNTLIELLKLTITLFSGGLAGALVTNYFKSRAEKRKKKVININTTEISLSPPELGRANILPTDSLKVTYEKQVFENLRLVTAFVQNTGFGGVDCMKLLATYPASTTHIKTITSSEPVFIPCILEGMNKNDKTEMIFNIGRMEKNDRLRLSLLIDTQQPNSIRFLPRGLDDVEFKIREGEYQKDTDSGNKTILSYKYIIEIIIAGLLVATTAQIIVYFFQK